MMNERNKANWTPRTTISLQKSTYEKLLNLRKGVDSFDTLVNRMIKNYEFTGEDLD
jgi:predicted CopG family antitoxin